MARSRRLLQQAGSVRGVQATHNTLQAETGRWGKFRTLFSGAVGLRGKRAVWRTPAGAARMKHSSCGAEGPTHWCHNILPYSQPRSREQIRISCKTDELPPKINISRRVGAGEREQPTLEFVYTPANGAAAALIGPDGPRAGGRPTSRRAGNCWGLGDRSAAAPEQCRRLTTSPEPLRPAKHSVSFKAGAGGKLIAMKIEGAPSRPACFPADQSP
ncbi:hypothetical protein AAFF_G00062880 [Aldrovandia affinis]|uniref:Uncharacterized protein n=1 Tax=Aldrovandia affinis TaxID=143900 RepID=A0AAD7S1X1_9TELE|nr:hypothetical protein AAFF_G00062880 [Aldrovandia affinis]